ncbi:uncharacterized protein LOC126161450 [Schistocerca cancellata]|uniref:uncharacterized protein LOC126161450 n=1 Tax=Schistocerca cancellata TaxID=274614 RepID=UPI0021179E42|nr:uncharacterized protein LOC126161450 [Schistocerca cancellata]
MPLDQDSKQITNPEEVTTVFNAYFSNIHEQFLRGIKSSSKNSIRSPANLNRNPESLLLPPTNPKNIMLAVSKLRTKFSTGMDEILHYVINNAGGFIAVLLAELFNS